MQQHPSTFFIFVKVTLILIFDFFSHRGIESNLGFLKTFCYFAAFLEHLSLAGAPSGPHLLHTRKQQNNCEERHHFVINSSNIAIDQYIHFFLCCNHCA